MANKNSSDATQKSKVLKKGFEHQNYRRQKEADELKEELMRKLEENAKKEKKRLAKKAKVREEVEHLKQESLVEQVPIILSGKKKNKHAKAEGPAIEPKVDVNNDAAKGSGDKFDDGVWNDGGNIWDENSSNVPSSSFPDEIWDEPTVRKQPSQTSTSSQRDTSYQSHQYKSGRTFYPSGNSGCRSKDRAGFDECKQKAYKRNAYKDNRKENSKRQDDRCQFQKRNSSAHSHRIESRLHSESAWDEPKQTFHRASGVVDAPLPEVNVWAERQSKLKEIEQMKPHNDYEEEAMLHQALELSRRQALEDQKRRCDLQKEYSMQLKYLTEHPEFAAELETADEIGATAAVPVTYSVDDNCDWDDKNQHESDDKPMYHNSHKARHSYSRSKRNLGCSYEMSDPPCTVKSNQIQHEYKGARPKYKQMALPHESWNASSTTYKNSIQHGDGDGIWGDVDTPNDNDGNWGDVVAPKDNNDDGIWGDVAPKDNNDDGIWGDVDTPNDKDCNWGDVVAPNDNNDGNCREVDAPNDNDGVWGDVDTPNDNNDGIWGDVPETKDQHTEGKENAQAELQQSTVCDRVPNSSLVVNKANSQIHYEENHKSVSSYNNSNNESYDNNDDNSDVSVDEKIVQKEEKHETSNIQRYCVVNTSFDNQQNCHYMSKNSIINEETKRSTYAVEEPSFLDLSHGCRNLKFAKDKEQDLWNDELDHLLKSVKGINLSSDSKFSTEPFTGLGGDINFRMNKGENSHSSESMEPAVTKMTVKAVSALQKNSKNTMSSVEEWLASTQKETPLVDPYVIEENTLKPKDNESNLYDATSVPRDQRADQTNFTKPSDSVERNNHSSTTALLPESPLEDITSMISSIIPNPVPESMPESISIVPNSVPGNIPEALRQIPTSSSFATPMASAPYSPFGPPVLPAPSLPVNHATATSSLMWQQAAMCSNPFLMQQLHALQMFYISLGVPAPNGFIPAPAVLPGQQTLLPQNAFEASNFQPQLTNNFNSLNLPYSAQYQVNAPVLPQFIPSSADVNKAMNSPVQPLLCSTSIPMGKPEDATPVLPPGIDVDYFRPQSEEMASLMNFSNELSNLHAGHNLTHDVGIPPPNATFVGISPPKPAEKIKAPESIRRPRHKFNDLYPLLQQANANQSAQNHTIPKDNKQMF